MKTAIEQDRHTEKSQPSPALHCFGWASDTNLFFPLAYGVQIVIVPYCGSSFLRSAGRSSLDVLVVINHHLYKM